MNVLIIGGTGLTGKNIVKMLLDRDYDVTIFHRGEHPLELSGSYNSRVREIIGDRDNEEAMERLAELEVDFLIDMVLKTEAQARKVVDLFRGKLKHTVCISSLDVYRIFDVILEKDSFLQTSPLREDSQLRRNLYPYDTDYDKIVVEKILLEAQAAGDFSTTILRFPAIYGPGQDTGSFREWFIIKRIIDGNHQVVLPDGGRMYFHHGFTENLAYAVVLTLENYRKADTIYHVGDEDVFTTRQLFELAGEIYGVEFEFYSIPYEIYAAEIETNPYLINNHLLCDLSKIKKDLGYKQLVHPAKAMQITFDWLMNNPRQDDYQITVDYEKEKELINTYFPTKLR